MLKSGYAVQILIIESDLNTAKLLSEQLRNNIQHLDVKCVTSAKTAIGLLERNKFFACIVNIDDNDENINELSQKLAKLSIPAFLIVDKNHDTTKNKHSEAGYFEFVLKSTNQIHLCLTKHIKSLIRNTQTKVLIVEDSNVFREIVRDILEAQKFVVLSADNGKSAIELIEHENDDIKLVVTDYIMPEMDGFELTSKLREKFSKERLAIIAISSEGQDGITEKFLKYGANDYIKKPFSQHEFVCRVNNTVENLSLIEAQKKMANTDYLTGLFNRHYLMDTMGIIHANAARGHLDYVVGLIDIDNIKMINDSYGHEVGDSVIKDLAAALKHVIRSSDILARVSGEEFCVVLTNVKDQNIYQIFEKIRHHVEKRTVKIEDGTSIRYTVSIGICVVLGLSFEEMFRTADEMLNEAKRTGRNKVCPDF